MTNKPLELFKPEDFDGYNTSIYLTGKVNSLLTERLRLGYITEHNFASEGRGKYFHVAPNMDELPSSLPPTHSIYYHLVPIETDKPELKCDHRFVSWDLNRWFTDEKLNKVDVSNYCPKCGTKLNA